MSAAYPRVPGHEIAGVVDAVGTDVDAWKVGDRVGVGWHGGTAHLRRLPPRRLHRLLRDLQVPGMTYDGGYAEYMVAPGRRARAHPRRPVRQPTPRR